MASMVSENLGTRDFARIFSITFLAYATGTALGPLATSLIFDGFGDYKIAFMCLLALYALSIPAALMVRKSAGNNIPQQL